MKNAENLDAKELLEVPLKNKDNKRCYNFGHHWRSARKNHV